MTVNQKIDQHIYKFWNCRSGNTVEGVQHNTGSTHKLSCLDRFCHVWIGEIKQVQNCKWLKSQTCILHLYLNIWDQRHVFLYIYIFCSHFQLIFVFHCVEKISGDPFCEISEDDQTHFGQDEATEIPSFLVQIWDRWNIKQPLKCRFMCLYFYCISISNSNCISSLCLKKEDNNWRTRMPLKFPIWYKFEIAVKY